jgi:hypothetical protein
VGRIRTIKPEFWKHEDLSELPPETHMLAAALLNYCDDEGYFKANVKLIKAECSPLREDSTNVRRSIEQLQNIGYIRLFLGSDGKDYGHVTQFLKHQRVDRPRPSEIKALEDSTNNRRIIDDESSLEGKGKEGKGKDKPAPLGAVSLARFIESNQDSQGRTILITDPIFKYAEETGIPPEYLSLCWRTFVNKYSDNKKKYTDWRAVFRSAVRENWLKLWWIADDGTYQLTTAGKQAKLQQGAAA